MRGRFHRGSNRGRQHRSCKHLDSLERVWHGDRDHHEGDKKAINTVVNEMEEAETMVNDTEHPNETLGDKTDNAKRA